MHENFQARARFTNNFKQHKCEKENQPRTSIWKDVSLGWIPDPKSDYTHFSNSLLAELY